VWPVCGLQDGAIGTQLIVSLVFCLERAFILRYKWMSPLCIFIGQETNMHQRHLTADTPN
jgi:hypothetical protein